MHIQDSLKATPLQLDYWRLTGEELPEGGVAPNLFFTCSDTVSNNEDLVFALAFKNAGKTGFDSIQLKLLITDENNRTEEISLPRKRPLISGDTIIIYHKISTGLLQGSYRLDLFVNTDNRQPEQYFFNNFLSKTFYVKRGAIVNTNDLIVNTDNEWKIFPNPALSQNIKVQFSHPTHKAETFRIVDLNGKTITNFTMAPGNHFIEIPVNNLKTGIYYLQRCSGKQYSSKKLLIIDNP